MTPIVIDDRPRCPTCGHLVNVQPTDNGSYYEPDERDVETAAPLDVERLAEAMALHRWAWLGWTDNAYGDPDSIARRLTAFATAATTIASEYIALTEQDRS